MQGNGGGRRFEGVVIAVWGCILYSSMLRDQTGRLYGPGMECIVVFLFGSSAWV